MAPPDRPEARLRVLVALTTEAEGDRVLTGLRRAGFEPEGRRVGTAAEMERALADRAWDLIVAGGFPDGAGPPALRAVREGGLEVPVIVVCDRQSEPEVRGLVRAGAHDVVFADDLAPLVPAVERALHDAAARRASQKTERALRLTQSAIAAAGEALDIAGALRTTVEQVCAHAGAAVGHVLLADGTAPGLLSTDTWHFDDPPRFAGFREAVRSLRHAPGAGLSGHVFATAAPAWVEHLAADSALAHPEAAAAGLASAFAFPVLAQESVVAVLEFFLERPRPPDQHLLEVLGRIGVQLGPVIERIRAVEELRQSESRYRLLFQGSPHPMWFHDAATLAFLAVNDAAVATYGYSRAEFLRMTLKDLWVSPETPSGVDSAGRTQRGLKWQHRKKDGTVIDVEVSSQAILFGGRRARVVLAQDVSDRKRAERRLRESERRYARAVAGANDGLWDWDLTTGEVYYSPRWKALLGYDDHEIGDGPEEWLGRVHPEDAERLRAKVAVHLRDGHGHLEEEHRVRHKDGGYRWMLGRGRAVWTADGKPSRMAGSLTDISERKRVEEQLLHDAYHDALTGLPNRTLFLDRLEHAVLRGRRHGAPTFAVLFLDLDRFKVVNDSLGHGVGDQLLIAVAGKLQACLRSADTVARLGGDEFTILLEDLRDPTMAMRKADRILRDLAQPMDLSGHRVAVTASIGITFGAAGQEPQPPAELLRDADIAMYRAKALGKGRYELFDPAMHERMVVLQRLEEDLRGALERGELRVHYQPIIGMATGRIDGFEALIRWEHPQRGMVQPDEFLPVAEETGLGVSIGVWVLREACRQARVWQEAFPQDPPLTMSVNLSARQLEDRGLVRDLEASLRDTGLKASSLKVEVTESRLESGETAAAALRGVKDLGVRVAIDDFGTGYSSLSRLTRLPIDALKIDRSFITGMATDPQSHEIVRMIVALTDLLGIDAVAEGVETEEQVRLLRALGCELGQGFLFCQTVAPEGVAAYVISRGRESATEGTHR